MGRRMRRQYSDAFKAEAVALVEEQGYGVTEAARRLGIDRSNLQRWRQEHAGEPRPLAEEPDREAELKQLREEVRKVTTHPPLHR